MRYYRIIITRPGDGYVYVPDPKGKGFVPVAPDPALSTYTSLLPGASPFTIGGTNPAALQVEIDAPMVGQHNVAGNVMPYVKIWGISLGEIGQAANLNGLNIAIYGGFAIGLPLAVPQQSGLLASGTIWNSIGTWYGTEQHLGLYFTNTASPSANQTTGHPAGNTTTPKSPSNQHPANLIFKWEPAQDFMAAVVTTLSVAFPKYAVYGAVSPNLVRIGAPAVGFFATLNQFAQYLREMSLSVLGGYAPDHTLYQGVQIYVWKNSIFITDGTTQTTPTQIKYTDLQGQPTWDQPDQVSVTVNLRADIQAGNYITLPPGPGIIGPNAGSSYYGAPPGQQYANAGDASVFQGTFYVNSTRHVGNSRDPAGTSWVTVLQCATPPPPKYPPVSQLQTYYKGNNSYGFTLPG